MSDNQITRRGFDEKDDTWFSKEAIIKLQSAQKEIIWLLDRGYKISSVLELVGGHYQLSARQRMALQRSTCSTKQMEERQKKLLTYDAASEDCVYMDGFNLIITLEVALSGSMLLLGNDGCLRDMAGLRGSYTLIDKTDAALQLIGHTLTNLNIPSAKILLDAPVSNSGKLKSRILQHAEHWEMPIEVELVKNPDGILSTHNRVITSDSVILDSCKSWFNLSQRIIENHIEEARVVRFVDKSKS